LHTCMHYTRGRLKAFDTQKETKFPNLTHSVGHYMFKTNNVL